MNIGIANKSKKLSRDILLLIGLDYRKIATGYYNKRRGYVKKEVMPKFLSALESYLNF